MPAIISQEKIEQIKIPKEALPFFFPGTERGILFVHGFSDSLCRVNGFAQYLSERGIATKGVLLPGHGRTWQELEKTGPEDWYREVERGARELKKEVKDVYIIGISFGGNLAMKLAAENPRLVKGIVCIEAPYRLRYQEGMKALIKVYEALGLRSWRKKYLISLKHPEKDLVFKQGVLERMPVKNIKEIINYLEKKQGFLSKVTCPVLLVQSDRSNLLTYDSAFKLQKRLKRSKKTEIYRVENVYHAFLSAAAKKAIFQKATSFFNIII